MGSVKWRQALYTCHTTPDMEAIATRDEHGTAFAHLNITRNQPTGFIYCHGLLIKASFRPSPLAQRRAVGWAKRSVPIIA